MTRCPTRRRRGSGIGRLFIGSNDAGQSAPSYLRSASCGLVEPTDTADIGFPGMHIVMNVTGELGGDLPWLEVSPASATLDPGQSVTVTVGMDSGATEENQPGTYGAGVGIGHDTPYDVPTVGVEMVATPPNNWGKVAGTVTGVDCDGSVSPLGGATIQLNGSREQIALTTDADGGYARWMASNNNPVRIIVAHDGYQPQTDQVRLRPRQTVTAVSARCARTHACMCGPPEPDLQAARCRWIGHSDAEALATSRFDRCIGHADTRNGRERCFPRPSA